MDKEEADEIEDMPIVSGSYYDPWTKRLMYDAHLSKVFVSHTWTIKESIEETKREWMARCFALEEQGMFTQRVMKQRPEKVAVPLTIPVISDANASSLPENEVTPLDNLSGNIEPRDLLATTAKDT